MGLLGWLSGRSAGKDIIRVDILMDYSAPLRALGTLGVLGSAAIRWIPLVDENLSPETWSLNRVFLAGLHYAKTLTIVSKETKAGLFEQIDEAVKKSFASKDNHLLEFVAWNLPINDPLHKLKNKSAPVWPWLIVQPEVIEQSRPNAAVGNPKVYSSTLKCGMRASPPDNLWIYLDMPMGLEAVLPAGSTLITLSTLAKELSIDFQQILTLVLWHINRFYGAPTAAKLGTEAKALAAAIKKIQSEAGQSR